MPEIKKIDGIWSEQQVKQIERWMSSPEGKNTIESSHKSAKEQAVIIKKISQVDASKIKEAFTFNY